MKYLLLLITLSYFNIGLILNFHTYDLKNKIFSVITIPILSFYSYKALKQLIKTSCKPKVSNDSNEIISIEDINSLELSIPLHEENTEEIVEPIKNPKFFRSTKEEDLIDEFFLYHKSKIDDFEYFLSTSASSTYSSEEIDDIISNLKTTIKIFYDFKDYCYSHGLGGCLYFQDMWEHCHNSQNPCFSYVTQFEDRLDFLIQNYDSEKQALIAHKAWRDFRDNIQSILLVAISEHEGILQKDFYNLFDPIYKSYIQKELKLLSDQNLIIREKQGSSYKLFTSSKP